MTMPQPKPTTARRSRTHGASKRAAATAVVARPVEVSPRMKIFGFMDGKISIVGDFDETPVDLIEAMTDGPI